MISNLEDDGAVKLGLDDALFAENRGVDELAFVTLADHEAVQRWREVERFDELAIRTVNLNARAFFLNADVDIAGGVGGDFAMAVADGLLSGRRSEPIGNEFVVGSE